MKCPYVFSDQSIFSKFLENKETKIKSDKFRKIMVPGSWCYLLAFYIILHCRKFTFELCNSCRRLENSFRQTDYMSFFTYYIHIRGYLPSCTLDRCRHYWFCAHAHVPWGHGFAGKVRCILDNHTKTSLLHGPSNDRPGLNYLKNACHIPRMPRVCFHQNHVQPCVSEIEEERKKILHKVVIE